MFSHDQSREFLLFTKLAEKTRIAKVALVAHFTALARRQAIVAHFSRSDPHP